MIRDVALEVLGVDEDASPAQIQEAITRKQAQLQQALDKAPTDALRNKYQQQLDRLQQLQAQLQAEPKTDAVRPASLSQTKFADLPQSATQFEDGPATRINLHEGQTLASRYEIQEQIGAGGMGAVYRAMDNTTGKEIALKVLLPALLKNERARERFLDEARISQQLSHPNIVNVFDVQQDGDFFFLTMELLEGQGLRQVMENRKLARQPFEVEEVLEILDPLCEALAYAHEYTVHRDIKPENIWVGEEGKLKVMDFGIARVQSTSQRTQTGAAMGTAYYMAPEQLKGQKEIDGRADLYSVAVMAYELLCGEVPAGMVEPLQSQRKGIPKKLAQVVHQGLSARPENRFADIKAFRTALQQSGKRGGFEFSLPWKGIGIAAGMLVAILGVGGLAANGSLDIEGLKKLLPMSKEEIAAQRASLAKIQGEIKVIKQRLESARRSLDSDVRDAERNDGNSLEALRHWRRLTEDALFSGSQITELEGDLSMAETLLRDNAFEQARPAFERVRHGYSMLQEKFTTAGELYAAEQVFGKEKNEWQSLKKKYGLSDPSQVAEALDMYDRARRQQQQGEFSGALASWQQGADLWQAARGAMQVEVTRIEAEKRRKREAEEARRRAAEAKRKAAEKARAAAIAKLNKDRTDLVDAIKRKAQQLIKSRINTLDREVKAFKGYGSESYSYRCYVGASYGQIDCGTGGMVGQSEVERGTISLYGLVSPSLSYAGTAENNALKLKLSSGCDRTEDSAWQYMSYDGDFFKTFNFTTAVSSKGVNYSLRADTRWPQDVEYKLSRRCTEGSSNSHINSAYRDALYEVRKELKSGTEDLARLLTRVQVMVSFDDRERAIYESDTEKFEALLR